MDEADKAAMENMSAEEKKALRDARKKAKEEEKAQKKANKAAAAAEIAAKAADEQPKPILFESADAPPKSLFGSYQMIQSHGDPAKGTGRKFTPVQELNASVPEGTEVWVRARVHNIRVTPKMAFLVMRQIKFTVQVLIEESESFPRAGLKWCGKELSTESVVDVLGTVVKADVLSCTQGDVELHAKRVYLVSQAESPLPFTLVDAGRPEAEEGVHVLRETRLEDRTLDLRVPAHKCILLVQAAVCHFFRTFLEKHNFTEIQTPKLIGGTSEGGANVFTLDYFGRPACLAQSPQLYKQMAICADFDRVFTIGPVFRAENSNTHRHLCEFVGLDIEMTFCDHYYEVLKFIDTMFTAIFDGLNETCQFELETINKQYPARPFKYRASGENLILTFPEAIKMLRDHGHTVGDLDDLDTKTERALGELVYEKYDTDFFMLTRFPMDIRPFYTMPEPGDERYSNSYDIFMRGEEIVSGAQRIHDATLLREMAVKKGIDVSTIEGYMSAFRYGAPPHAGAGVGLERVVMLFLGLGNVRECTMFPRDPQRLTP